MKLLLKILFLLTPVFADCQTGAARQSGQDSIITPPLHRQWTAAEFQQAFNSIISRQNGSAAEIPTIEKNKQLITKLTDIDNYWFLDSSSVELRDRFNFSLSFYDLIKAVFVNYYQKSNKINGRLSYDKEIAAFWGLLFELTKSQMELTEEFMKVNPNLTQSQLDGLKKMIQGYTIMEAGALITIEKDYALYSEASICEITRSFRSFYLFMYNRIGQEDKTKFDRKIADLEKTHPVQCVRTALQGK